MIMKVLAGDFAKGDAVFVHGYGELKLRQPEDRHGKPTVYKVAKLQELELADEQAAVRVFGAAAWGTVGALVAGPFGLLAGAVLGGRGEKVTFVAVTHDGKRLMAQCDKSTWTAMQACRF